jgi:hypothetical protein
MKRKNRILLAAFLLVALALTSCAPAPLTADQVIQKMAENGKNLKSGQIQLEMKIALAGQTLNLSSNGVFENPDRSFLTLTSMGNTIQVLSLSPSESYTRRGDDEKWLRADASTQSQSGSLYDFAKNPEALLKHYQAAKLLPEDTVAECATACYHVGFQLNMAELFKDSGALETTLKGVAFNTPADVELWIGKTDFYTHRQKSKFLMTISGQDVTVDVLISQTGINKPVVIPTP